MGKNRINKDAEQSHARVQINPNRWDSREAGDGKGGHYVASLVML